MSNAIFYINDSGLLPLLYAIKAKCPLFTQGVPMACPSEGWGITLRDTPLSKFYKEPPPGCLGPVSQFGIMPFYLN